MDNSNPHEIIPISFTLKSLAGNHFYQINNKISQPEKKTNISYYVTIFVCIHNR